MAVSPEAFLVLRSRFVRSHATLSVCQYVLGIGDRHLSNFLINEQTGAMIGIDFGHAFGSATQVSSHHMLSVTQWHDSLLAVADS